MKKQIFKLTSILLAMVMVFSLFSIIPISAEDASAKKAAVVALQAAWKNLTVKNAAEMLGVSYINTTWIKDDNLKDYQSEDNPKDLDSNVDETSKKTTVTSTGKNMFWSNEVGKGMSNAYFSKAEKSQIKDLYFYYKSNVTVMAKPIVCYTDGTTIKDTVNQAFSSSYELPKSGDQWRKVSYIDWMNNVTTYNPDNWETRYASKLGMTDLSRIGFTLSTAAEDVEGTAIFSNMFVVYDENLLESESDNPWSDDEWILNAFDIDAAYYDADYDWYQFLDAREAVRSYAEGLAVTNLKNAANEMIMPVASHAYPSGLGRTSKIRTQNDKTDIYGDYYLTETISTTGETNGIWMHQSVDSYKYSDGKTADAAIYFGDYVRDDKNLYITIKVNSIDGADKADIGFWCRVTGTPQYTSIFSNKTLTVEAKKEYAISIDDILSNMNAENDTDKESFINWRTNSKENGFKTTIFSIYNKTSGAQINVTVGSIVSTTNYSIDPEIEKQTGADFVSAMALQDISKCGNTEAFDNALKTALEVFPEAKKTVAVEKLRDAAKKMTKYGESILYPAKYWDSGRKLTSMVESENPAYGDYTVKDHTINKVDSLTVSNSTTNNAISFVTPDDKLTGRDTYTKLNVSGDGDAYITIKVEDIVDANTATLGFRYRSDSINNVLKKTINVEDGKEYTISLTDLFKDDNNVGSNGDWETFFASQSKFDFLTVNAIGANVIVTVGSAVYADNYKPDANSTGRAFVTEMLKLKAGTEFNAYSNTDEFEKALKDAEEAYADELDLLEMKEEIKSAYNEMFTACQSALYPNYLYPNTDGKVLLKDYIHTTADGASLPFGATADMLGDYYVTNHNYTVTYTNTGANSSQRILFYGNDEATNVNKDVSSFGGFYFYIYFEELTQDINIKSQFIDGGGNTTSTVVYTVPANKTEQWIKITDTDLFEGGIADITNKSKLNGLQLHLSVASGSANVEAVVGSLVFYNKIDETADDVNADNFLSGMRKKDLTNKYNKEQFVNTIIDNTNELAEKYANNMAVINKIKVAGDCNAYGGVDLRDLVRIAKYVDGVEAGETVKIDKLAADGRRDGTIDADDEKLLRAELLK